MHSPSVSRTASREPLYRSTSLETRSRSPSPRTVARSTRDQHGHDIEYYGGPNLTDRSRTPSPASTAPSERATLPAHARKLPMSPNAATLPMSGRRLPHVPQKPSTLNIPPNPPPHSAMQTSGRRQNNMPQMLPSPTLPQEPHQSPGSINFPRLSASPTHHPGSMQRPDRRDVMPNNLNRPPSHAPHRALPHNGTPPSMRRQRPGMGRRTNSTEATWTADAGRLAAGAGGMPRSCSGQQFASRNLQQHPQQPPPFHNRPMPTRPPAHTGPRHPHFPAAPPQLAPAQLAPRHRTLAPDAFDNNRYLAESYDQEMALRLNRRNAAGPQSRPLPNGFKPPTGSSVRGSSGLGSESDDDDWC